MRSLFVMLLVPLAVLAGSAAAQAPSGLQGRVTLSPFGPSCVDGPECSKPAPGVQLLFTQEGKVKARVTTGSNATYRVLLAPGRYAVAAPGFRRGSGVAPRHVRVWKGRVTRVNLEIDTGMQ